MKQGKRNAPGYFSFHNATILVRFSVILLLFPSLVVNAQNQYLHRSFESLQEVNSPASTKTAHYKLMFGEKDPMVKSVSQYAFLVIDPQGKSKPVSFGREELICYVLKGTGMLHYQNKDIPISKDDFFYVPVNTRHSFSNPRSDTLTVVVMGFKIPDTVDIKPTPGLQLANANDVKFQELSGHGETSRFRLLIGETTSKRDKIAAAYQVTSMFVIDFDPTGTNNPHHHEKEEEIYFVLRGEGDMVAGVNAEGEKMRHPAKAGDGYFFSRDTYVGFYSDTKPGEEHSRILAVRFKTPTPKK